MALAFCCLYTVRMSVDPGLFQYFAYDFRAFWATAEIIVTKGFAGIYDLNLQTNVQMANFGPSPAPAPFAYLPLFAAPFVLLLPFGKTVGLVVWLAANSVMTGAYLRRLLRIAHLPIVVIVPTMLSLPVFGNFFWAQTGLWLLVCAGEATLSLRSGRRFIGGIWLAGLLLKPQLLMLVGPALLFTGQASALLGLALGAAAVLATSLALGGLPAITDWMRTVASFAEGVATNAPESMSNWRAVGLVSTQSAGILAAWSIAGCGMLVTCLLAIRLWRPANLLSQDTTNVVMLGTMAATLSVAWHSHTHMAMVLIPSLLFAMASYPQFLRMARWWFFVPTLVLSVTAAGGFALAAQALLALNLGILIWCVRTLAQQPTDTHRAHDAI